MTSHNVVIPFSSLRLSNKMYEERRAGRILGDYNDGVDIWLLSCIIFDMISALTLPPPTVA